MDVLATGIFLATANKMLIDYLFEPVKRRYPDVDFFWLLYVALATGAAIAWFAEVNLFASVVANETLGRVLSALFVGGGSSLIHDLFDGGTDIAEADYVTTVYEAD